MKQVHKVGGLFFSVFTAIVIAIIVAYHPDFQHTTVSPPQTPTATTVTEARGDAAEALQRLAVKGRAPKTDYARAQFGDGWEMKEGCDLRNYILRRDLTNTQLDDRCRVLSGQLADPYTGKTITFTRGEATSSDVQIDHVVALSNAWQTGAQALTAEQRIQFANDPLELLAVDGEANMQKSDGDAATWLPSNRSYRCQYIARQIAVKAKYQLWVTAPEKDAMLQVLSSCPGQQLPTS